MTDTASLEQWRPARRYPGTYPGDAPDGSYVIIDDRVFPLVIRGNDLRSAEVVIEGEPYPLDLMLIERGLPQLSHRYISLAYGANRNPGTLAIKMHNYDYESRHDGLVLPVLKGVTFGRDVVACGLSGQGYLYADLLLADAPRVNEIEAWFPLLDTDQLRVMHDGEGVREGAYTVAQFPSRLDGFSSPVQALGYAGNQPIFVSPFLERPVAYSTVLVTERDLPAMDATEMMRHVLAIDHLERRIAELLEVDGRTDTVLALMDFMNERWWIDFDGQDQPDGRYGQVYVELQSVIEANQRPYSSAASMRRRELALDVQEAYDANPSWMIGRQLAAFQ